MEGRAVPYAAPMGLPGNRPLPGFFSTSAGLSGNRAVGPTSCHARDHGTELGFPMPYFFVIVPLGVLVALAWLVLAKKAYENPT